MAEASSLYTQAVILLGSAVVAAPLFKKIGLGTVLGYLFAGIIVGPVIGVIQNAEDILHFAELGIVFLLFIVGLELKPSRLWAMRHDIFGLGALQVMSCGLVLSLLIAFVVDNANVALVAGFGLALSSTAFALQMLETSGNVNTRYGRKTFSILLFQDLAIIPLLAVVPLLTTNAEVGPGWPAFLIAVLAILLVVAAGRYLLSPCLGMIAKTGAKEAMIAAALLVVFGSAMAMHSVGLSMALGSFLAGVLLAESSYRLELEANIEPFRGILLGLFFVAVGLSLNLGVIVEYWYVVLFCAPLLMAMKGLLIYICCRLFGSSHPESVKVAAVLPQHGEFGFVLFAAAASIGILDPTFKSGVRFLAYVFSLFPRYFKCCFSRRKRNGPRLRI